MYVPPLFHEPDRARILDLVERYSFATLVTSTPEGPFVSHVPFLLDRDRGPHGTLLGHLARANPQWKHFESNDRVLAVFTGPHCYVSPSWYAPNPANVPTWNYAVVHARGPAKLVAPGKETLAVVKRLTELHEPSVGGTYSVAMDNAALEKLSQGIVAFTIEIAELTGKFKLSQNRPEGDRVSVLEHLSASGDPAARDVAALMKRDA
jgi:transcriptional regulator